MNRREFLQAASAAIALTKSLSTPSESPAAPPRVVIAGNGVIRGTVKLDGPAPSMPEIANEPCHPGAPRLKPRGCIGTSLPGNRTRNAKAF